MKTFTLALASAAVLAVSAASAQPAPTVPPPPPFQPTTAAMPFLALAGESDVFEITSSQVALQKSQNPEIRRYATMMIDHHTRTTNTALAQAKAAGVTPPPGVLGPQKRGLIDQLMAANGPAFDRLYLQQQVPAHEQALTLHTTYARGGDTPQLRMAAQGAVPIVTQHLAEARAMLGRM